MSISQQNQQELELLRELAKLTARESNFISAVAQLESEYQRYQKYYNEEQGHHSILCDWYSLCRNLEESEKNFKDAQATLAALQSRIYEIRKSLAILNTNGG